MDGGEREIWSDGFAAQGTVAAGFPVLTVQLRADVGYQTFQGRGDTPITSETGVPIGGARIGDRSIWSGTLSTDAGLSAALGATLPVRGLNAFFEARLHHVFRDDGSTRSYPVVAGFLF